MNAFQWQQLLMLPIDFWRYGTVKDILSVRATNRGVRDSISMTIRRRARKIFSTKKLLTEKQSLEVLKVAFRVVCRLKKERRKRQAFESVDLNQHWEKVAFAIARLGTRGYLALDRYLTSQNLPQRSLFLRTLLLNKKANGVNLEKFALRCLFRAIDVADGEGIKHILCKVTEINSTCRRFPGHTPLVRACVLGSSSIVSILLNNSADPNHICQNGDAPLHFAVRKGNYDCTQILLKKGANPNLQGCSGKTPLILALERKKLAIARLLLCHKALPNRVSRDGNTPLIFALEKSGNARSICYSAGVSLLLEKGADPNIRASDRRLPLHIAWKKNLRKSVMNLLEFGADINGLCPGGKSVLWTAVRSGETRAVNFLLDRGADPNVRGPGGKTVLALAVRDGHVQITEALVNAGADPRMGDDNGVTPLLLALDNTTWKGWFKRLMEPEKSTGGSSEDRKKVAQFFKELKVT